MTSPKAFGKCHRFVELDCIADVSEIFIPDERLKAVAFGETL
jgi:hypothetical protein